MSVHLSVFPSILYVHISISSESFDFNHISLFILLLSRFTGKTIETVSQGRGMGQLQKKGQEKEWISMVWTDGWIWRTKTLMTRKRKRLMMMTKKKRRKIRLSDLI